MPPYAFYKLYEVLYLYLCMCAWVSICALTVAFAYVSLSNKTHVRHKLNQPYQWQTWIFVKKSSQNKQFIFLNRNAKVFLQNVLTKNIFCVRHVLAKNCSDNNRTVSTIAQLGGTNLHTYIYEFFILYIVKNIFVYQKNIYEYYTHIGTYVQQRILLRWSLIYEYNSAT